MFLEGEVELQLLTKMVPHGATEKFQKKGVFRHDLGGLL